MFRRIQNSQFAQMIVKARHYGSLTGSYMGKGFCSHVNLLSEMTMECWSQIQIFKHRGLQLFNHLRANHIAMTKTSCGLQ